MRRLLCSLFGHSPQKVVFHRYGENLVEAADRCSRCGNELVPVREYHGQYPKARVG